MLLVVVSGYSGSGKTLVLHVLEDMGFYCVNNLPIELLSQLIESLAIQCSSVAVSIDVRNLPATLEILNNVLHELPKNLILQFLFLETDRCVLIQRYSATRRRHPLFHQHVSLKEAIDKERLFLTPLRAKANLVIDTSKLSVHQLAEVVRTRFNQYSENNLAIIFQSFGFKYGVPRDIDYLLDVRFLPNPYWDLTLRPLTGLNKKVINFLNDHTEVSDFISSTYAYINQWLPMIEISNRSYLTIAIGCTGGRHRSVYVANCLTKIFTKYGRNAQSHHTALQ